MSVGTDVSAPSASRAFTSGLPGRQRLGTALLAELAELGPASAPGSPRCRCHTDPSHLHGPYPSWIRKVGAKTVTRTLSPVQLERYRPLFDNTKRLRELISELEMLSAETVEQAEGWTSP